MSTSSTKKIAEEISFEVLSTLAEEKLSPPKEEAEAPDAEDLVGLTIENSPYRFEVARMLYLGLAPTEIQLALRTYFGFRPSVREIEAFEKFHYPYYKETIHQLLALESNCLREMLVDEQTREGPLAPIFREADRLIDMLGEVDERIAYIKELGSELPSMEHALINWYKLKKEILQRLTTLTGDSGLISLTRRAIERVAKLALSIFIPAVPSESRDALFEKFARDLDRVAAELRVMASGEEEESRRQLRAPQS